jgi:hypothetical protein
MFFFLKQKISRLSLGFWFIFYFIFIDSIIGYYGNTVMNSYTDMAGLTHRMKTLSILDYKPEVVFFGDSRFHAGIKPAEFNKYTGLKSYNSSVGASTPFLSFKLFSTFENEIFSNVKYVFIGISDWHFSRDTINRFGHHGFSIFDYFLLSKKDLFNYFPKGIVLTLFNIYNYGKYFRQYLINEVLGKGWSKRGDELTKVLENEEVSGWLKSNGLKLFQEKDLEAYFENFDWYTNPPDNNLYTAKSLNDFITYLKLRKIKPVLLNMPINPILLKESKKRFGENIKEFDDFYNSLAKKHQIILLNHRANPPENMEDFGDDFHMTPKSALIYSGFLGKIFNKYL